MATLYQVTALRYLLQTLPNLGNFNFYFYFQYPHINIQKTFIRSKFRNLTTRFPTMSSSLHKLVYRPSPHTKSPHLRRSHSLKFKKQSPRLVGRHFCYYDHPPIQRTQHPSKIWRPYHLLGRQSYPLLGVAKRKHIYIIKHESVFKDFQNSYTANYLRRPLKVFRKPNSLFLSFPQKLHLFKRFLTLSNANRLGVSGTELVITPRSRRKVYRGNTQRTSPYLFLNWSRTPSTSNSVHISLLWKYFKAFLYPTSSANITGASSAKTSKVKKVGHCFPKVWGSLIKTKMNISGKTWSRRIRSLVSNLNNAPKSSATTLRHRLKPRWTQPSLPTLKFRQGVFCYPLNYKTVGATGTQYRTAPFPDNSSFLTKRVGIIKLVRPHGNSLTTETLASRYQHSLNSYRELLNIKQVRSCRTNHLNVRVPKFLKVLTRALIVRDKVQPTTVKLRREYRKNRKRFQKKYLPYFFINTLSSHHLSSPRPVRRKTLGFGSSTRILSPCESLTTRFFTVLFASHKSIITQFRNFKANANPITNFPSKYTKFFQPKLRQHNLISPRRKVRLSFTPSYSFQFTTTPFFFLHYLQSQVGQSHDLLYSLPQSISNKPYTVFPDSNVIKASIFRRINKQKVLFQARKAFHQTINNGLNQRSRELLHPSASSTMPLTLKSWIPTTSSVLLSNHFVKQSRLHLFPKNLTRNVTPRIKRIRFKPGYGRIWRMARISIKDMLNLNIRYQYRLTPKLQKLYFQSRRLRTHYSSFTVGYALLSARFAPDNWILNSLVSASNIYINGHVCTNVNIRLFTNDFIQLLINLKFYITLRWLKNWTTNKRSKVAKIFYRKLRPGILRGPTKTPKKSRNLPLYFFDLQYVYSDIPRCFEVDYFSLSLFVVHSQLNLEKQLPLQHTHIDQLTLNMYNWKYIT